MPDPIDDGRDALGDAHPTRDLWADAVTRADRPDEVPLAPAPARSTRPRWLAVAALLALVTGTVAALSLDDGGDDVQTTPASTPGEGTTSTSIFPSEGCFFAVSGDPIVLTPGAGDPPLFDPAFQPEGVTAAHGALGDAQVVEVQVPGVVVTDLVGERVEDVELQRGTASIWFGPDFVQVRWFPGTEEPCDSFTVTVAGSTEDGNRHAAVALADRLLLPTEIGVEEPPGSTADLLQGDWQLERSTVDGKPTDGGGLVFSFDGGEATWTDGCNTFAGTLVPIDGSMVTLVGAVGTKVHCPANPTMEAVGAVMGAEQIDVSTEGDQLVLRAGPIELRLRSAGDFAAG